MNLPNQNLNSENFGHERKHKKIILCPKCKGKANIYYTPQKEKPGYWIYYFRIVGIECEHIHEGRSYEFHEMVKSMLPNKQTTLFNF